MVSVNDEMITVAARIPLEHYRELKRISETYALNSTSEIIRAAVAEFVHNHQPGETS